MFFFLSLPAYACTLESKLALSVIKPSMPMSSIKPWISLGFNFNLQRDFLGEVHSLC